MNDIVLLISMTFIIFIVVLQLATCNFNLHLLLWITSLLKKWYCTTVKCYFPLGRVICCGCVSRSVFAYSPIKRYFKMMMMIITFCHDFHSPPNADLRYKNQSNLINFPWLSIRLELLLVSALLNAEPKSSVHFAQPHTSTRFRLKSYHHPFAH